MRDVVGEIELGAARIHDGRRLAMVVHLEDAGERSGRVTRCQIDGDGSVADRDFHAVRGDDIALWLAGRIAVDRGLSHIPIVHYNTRAIARREHISEPPVPYREGVAGPYGKVPALLELVDFRPGGLKLILVVGLRSYGGCATSYPKSIRFWATTHRRRHPCGFPLKARLKHCSPSDGIQPSAVSCQDSTGPSPNQIFSSVQQVKNDKTIFVIFVPSDPPVPNRRACRGPNPSKRV
jgi:hypothetical protein